MEYWKFKAVDRLREYTAQRTAILNIAEEIARLESEATSIKSATTDGTPVKGGGSTREDRMLSNIVQRAELQLMLERAKISVRTVERGLSVLSSQERSLLDRMYITPERGAVKRIMEENGLLEESSLYRRVNKALVHFTVAMYGATEN